MGINGYYRHPTLHGDTIVFVSEDDLWAVPATGGVASRLTANPGSHSHPRFSPDGTLLAFVSRDEGRAEAHVMAAGGGPSRRLTHFGALTQVVDWAPSGDRIIVATDHQQPFSGWTHLWSVALDGSQPEPIGIGHAASVAHGPGGARAIGRNTFDPARWKRYRGGRAGSVWVDREGSGDFRPLVDLPGNLAAPMWVGRRIYFLSDHEGVGNLYSTTPSGRGLTRHTDHSDFYARFPSTDGRRIVYHCGADLWLLDPSEGPGVALDVQVPSARPQLNRKYVKASSRIESVDLHPNGHSLAVTTRGAAFTGPLWEGSMIRHGPISRHRRRLASWLADGERILSVTDEPGEERLIVERADGTGEPVLIDRELGRIRSVDAAPAGPSRVAVTNHRHELWLVDLTRRSARMVHRSPYAWIRGVSWSPDGRWLAFAASLTRTSQTIHLHDTRNRQTVSIGEPEFVDHSPSFSADGSHLGFLSSRVLEPVPDSAFHDYGFPSSTLPMVVTLRSGDPSPFAAIQREPRPPGAPANANQNGAEPGDVDIDLDGIEGRVRPVPVQPGRYSGLALGSGRIFFLSWPVASGGPDADDKPRGTLQAWDMAADKVETVAEGATGFQLSADGKVLAVMSKRRLRVVPSGWKDDKSGKDTPGRETGWVDLDRMTLLVQPQDEWRQMFTEAWRLQRDHFWSEDMSGVDWLEIHDRYLALIDRVGSRSEFSDLMWEMQGELGTSHAYELGGDYRPEPTWSQGHLGADIRWSRGAWRIVRLPLADGWDPEAASPLTLPGVEAAEGDRILAIDGVAPTRWSSPASMLVGRAGRPVSVTLARGRRKPEVKVVKPLSSERPLWYRDWVERNRRAVAEATGGRAGYLHIPDMGSPGFAEFHRSWRREADKDGLVVDVRFNRGGNVSHLLLRKLAQRRIGYRVTRWREPWAVPTDAPAGPMVCLINEMAGSDGDIFAHSFRLLGLGPLIGTRTWGGVVGIWPQQSLVDGTVTTQPEFGTWFVDIGYDLENRGTEPDTDVVDRPGTPGPPDDEQLRVAIAELIDLMDSADPRPEFGPFPSTAPPRLPDV